MDDAKALLDAARVREAELSGKLKAEQASTSAALKRYSELQSVVQVSYHTATATTMPAALLTH